ncbi:hypothetical protein SO802_012226 [Lithocarpus litseifolius]|uniref:Reverse transcriptase domain-containing protein n=1 Tax=Lithocarpus litseifolius TaxID=425828 RepID=A0AAW2D266_9ROSI
MNLLCWNCRGLGNRQTVQELGELVRAQDPSVVFLAETWLEDARLGPIRDSLLFVHYHGVSRITRGGGLAIFWKQGFNLVVESSSQNHIDVVINKGTDNAWRFTGIYGAPETHLRPETWELLRGLHRQVSMPWLCGGDFNEILKSHEKRGGRLRPYGQIEKFREVLDECNLLDLGFSGNKFTWSRSFPNGGMVWERLDRAVSSADWYDLFPATCVQTLACVSSDHNPICIHLGGIEVKSARPWRFEQMWLEDLGCRDTVVRTWGRDVLGSPIELVVSKLEACQKSLAIWSRNSFCHVRREITEKKKMLRAAERDAAMGRRVDHFLKLKTDIVDLLRLEEKMWHQRSKEHWMISGDRNSKYFHTKASQRFRRNRIVELRNPEGVLVSGDGDISAMVRDYYKNLFLSSRPTEVDDVALSIKPVVTDDMNNSLIRPFSRAEVECALSQMAPLKAPGPDGMPPIFFQKFWSVIGDDVVHAVLFCLNSGRLLPGMNHTFISLIPKAKNPESVSEFRPIALCNILYKLVSKVLANRLKKFLPHIISESQSAFQSDKAISDNILVAFETLHHMKRKKGGKSGHLALKLDISKAYDRLEWVFLKKVMERMGFHSRWVGWIMECVQSVTYSVLINGVPTETIIPSRGIRQGDPLSPYLFLLCSEGFCGLLDQAVAEKSIEGFSLCKYGPKISHLLFADDSLLFCRARVEDVTKILEILGKYEKASGQKLNANKTTIFFGGNVRDSAKLQVQSLLGVLEIKEYEKYLGLPAVVGRHKIASFNYIKDRVWGKLQGWKGKLLSQAGKEVLLKAVVQAIPTFAMSCFRLPVGLCQDIEMLVRKFWWGQWGERRKIHWSKWEVLCKPKEEGGLGFKDLCKFNEALLAKQVWKLVHDKQSLFYKVFKAKYFPHGSIFEATVSSGSFAWQSIMKSRHLIEAGARWRVGDGQQVRIFIDKWLQDGEGVLSSPSAELHPEATVSMLINRTSGWWNVQLIDRCFHPPDATRIKALPLCSTPQSDMLFWPLEKSGKYSVKSGFRLLCDSRDSSEGMPPANTEVSSFWKKLWKIQVPGKIKHFLWRACTNSLATKANLVKRKIVTDATCSRCSGSHEDTLHSLWSCCALKEVWEVDFGWISGSGWAVSSFTELVKLVFTRPDLVPLFAATAWSVWFHRNKVRLNENTRLMGQIAGFARDYVRDFRSFNSSSSTVRSTAPKVWSPPGCNEWKINFDGAMFCESDEAGVGVVVRNSSGVVVAALTEKIRKPPSVEVLELLAARRAALFSDELGLDRVIFEGDSEQVIKALQWGG